MSNPHHYHHLMCEYEIYWLLTCFFLHRIVSWFNQIFISILSTAIWVQCVKSCGTIKNKAKNLLQRRCEAKRSAAAAPKFYAIGFICLYIIFVLWAWSCCHRCCCKHLKIVRVDAFLWTAIWRFGSKWPPFIYIINNSSSSSSSNDKWLRDGYRAIEHTPRYFCRLQCSYCFQSPWLWRTRNFFFLILLRKIYCHEKQQLMRVSKK